jgi:hypothetical protein
MRCEDCSTQRVDYLAGGLPIAGREAIERHVASCAACREALEALSVTWQRLGDIPAERPDSASMRARFDAMLAIHEHEQPEIASPARRTGLRLWLSRHHGLQPLFQACAAVLLVVAGIQVGREITAPPPASPDLRELRNEVRDLRQMVTLSLMQQQSASERLKGVSWSNQLDRPGNEVVSALIDTLMHDANVNVRLASIDALRRFAEREVVRSAAIHALDTQPSPLVQMALIDFVVETQERGAVETLRRLSRDDAVNEAVRARAAWGINHLEAA